LGRKNTRGGKRQKIPKTKNKKVNKDDLTKKTKTQKRQKLLKANISWKVSLQKGNKDKSLLFGRRHLP
jgi:hypothetical protein